MMTADELIAQGQAHERGGEFAAAAESYLRAFELAPADARLPWEAARLYLYFASDAALAVRWFEEVLADTPSHVLSCIELGKLLTRRGDHARAKDLLQQAVLHNNLRSTLPEMFPDGQKGSSHAHALAWMNLGRLALVAGDDESLGRAAVTRLLEDLEDDARVLTLGNEARAAGKPYAALVAVEELLARAPDPERARRMGAEVLRRDPQHAAALAFAAG